MWQTCWYQQAAPTNCCNFFRQNLDNMSHVTSLHVTMYSHSLLSIALNLKNESQFDLNSYVFIYLSLFFMLKSNLLKCMSHPRFWVPFLEGGYLAEKMSTSSQTTVVVQLRMSEILADMMRMLGIILGRERVSQCQTGADWSLRPQYCAVIGQKSAAGHLPPSKGWPSPAPLARCRSEQWVADY